MKSEWKNVLLREVAELNPREFLAKGRIARKVAMDVLKPYCKNIPFFESAPYTGGAKFRNGDTIMARITPCLENGKTAKVGILHADEVGYGSTEYIVFRAKPEMMDPDYLYYLVISPAIRNPAIKSMSGTSGRQRVQTEVVKNTEIKVPPLPIQQKITSILSLLDDKIELNSRIICNLEELAKAALSNWLEKNQEVVSWVLLSDVADVNSDTYSLEENWPFIHYLDTGGLNVGRVDEIQRIEAGREKLPSRARRKIQPGDILFSTVRPNQRHYGMLMNPLPNMLVSTGFAVVRSKNAYASNSLIYLHLIAPSFIEAMQRLGEQSTSAYPSIKPSELLTCRIPLIQTKASLAFQEKLTCFFSHIGELQEENNRLAAIRDALLPRLMSGEWDAVAMQR